MTSYYITAVFNLPCKSESRFTMYPNPDSLIKYPHSELLQSLILLTFLLMSYVEMGPTRDQQFWVSDAFEYNSWSNVQRPEPVPSREYLCCFESGSKFLLAFLLWRSGLHTICWNIQLHIATCWQFPWVLSNYTSQVLDLQDANNYRDLSRPIGVVNPKNEEEVREK